MAESTEIALSACSIFDCVSCIHRTKHKCRGCSQGNALLAAHGESRCAIYSCVLSHNIATCNDCTEQVCPFTRSLAMVCPVRSNFEKKRTYSRRMSDHFSKLAPEKQDTSLVSKKLDKAIERLPWYLFAVQEFQTYGVQQISSEDISRKIGVKSWLVRRDLSQFGEFGRPSVGYETSRLRECLTEILHLDTPSKIVWIGADRLLADISIVNRFLEHNYHIVAIFDTDISKTSKMIGSQRIMSIDDMPDKIREYEAGGAVIATAADEAQVVTDALIASGIRGILNLTSTLIATPPNVCVRSVDIVAELFALSYYCGELHGANDE